MKGWVATLPTSVLRNLQLLEKIANIRSLGSVESLTTVERKNDKKDWFFGKKPVRRVAGGGPRRGIDRLCSQSEWRLTHVSGQAVGDVQ